MRALIKGVHGLWCSVQRADLAENHGRFQSRIHALALHKSCIMSLLRSGRKLRFQTAEDVHGTISPLPCVAVMFTSFMGALSKHIAGQSPGLQVISKAACKPAEPLSIACHLILFSP